MIVMTMKSYFDPHLTADELQRFWSKVDQRKPDECWEWTAGTNHYGYGLFGRHDRAHRISYFIANGPFPNKMFVCHRCDNPPCVNPKHLFLGTSQDNVDDMIKKGRNAKGVAVNSAKMTKAGVREIRRLYATGNYAIDDLCELFGLTKAPMFQIVTGQTWKHVGGPTAKPGNMRGESNSQAKLTADSVREVRRIYATGGISQSSLAARYGVTQQTIYDIVARRSWKHID